MYDGPRPLARILGLLGCRVRQRFLEGSFEKKVRAGLLFCTGAFFFFHKKVWIVDASVAQLAERETFNEFGGNLVAVGSIPTRGTYVFFE